MYLPADLISYLECSVEELCSAHPRVHIILAGDVNTLSNTEVMERTGLTEVVGQPTRGENKLNRLYLSDPNIYSSIKVVQLLVKSDHRAIVAYTGCRKMALNKTSAVIELRRRTPNQHAMFL